jgi:putative ABC transport system permease protein
VSLAAAIYPAFFLSTIRPINLLRDQRPVPTAAKLRNTLVIFQFIITAVLICSTLVIFFQLKYIANKDLGFDQKGLMVIENMNALGTSVNSFKQEITESPLVEIASFANSIPGNSSIYQSSYQTTEMQNSVALRTIPVDANFIETMGISLIEGSNFRDKINLDSTVAIINEAAKKALGLDITIGQEISQGQKVIGLVSDFHMASLREGIEPIVMEYTPTGNILALRLDPRKRASLSDFIYRINSLWNEMSPNTAMQYSFIDDTFAKMSTQEKIEATGMVALTFMALIIACLGLVGLATFTMKKREKEIGIRKTLGSSATEIVTLLSLEFLRLVMIALPIAIPVAWYFMDKWLQNFAYHISLHWWIFLLGGILSIVIAFIVVSFQSIRAATVNPVASLHNQ